MSEQFLGEIRIVSFNYAPRGWAFCNGALLPINENAALFSILGTTYGGDGRVNFGLPNLQGRTPVHVGNGISLGELGGETNHTLNISEMPAHNHIPLGNSAVPNTGSPANAYWSDIGNSSYSTSLANQTSMRPADVTNTGGSQSHENMSPYLVLNFIIALSGIFPSRN